MFQAKARDNRASSRLERAQKQKENRQEKRRFKSSSTTTSSGRKSADLPGMIPLSSGLDRSTPTGSQPPTPTGSDTGSSVNTPGTLGCH